MLLSHSHRFLFIHVFKTAGISVRAALEPYAHLPHWSRWQRLRLRLRLAVDRKAPEGGWHISAAQAQDCLPPALFDSYFKFAFVRNPWDWQVSIFHYILEHPEHELYPVVSRMESFEDFLWWRVRDYRMTQKECIATADGHLLLDFVGRFETLAADFAAICRRLGLQARLGHLNRSVHQDYRSYYTPRLVRLVAQHWREDIELFGYRFASPGPVPDRVAA
jgi:hypothetical protein